MTTLSTVKNVGTALVLGLGLLWASPAQASYDWNNWQPPLGMLHRAEDALENQLDSDYSKGLIDTSELALFRRDLDGITTQEEEYRMDHSGLGRNDERAILAKLLQFQRDLNRATADKFDALASIHVVGYAQ
jgi:hypothetical protein